MRRESILVWDKDEDGFNVEIEHEQWDKQLVLGSRWLYRQGP